MCVNGTYMTNRRRTWLDLAEMLELDDMVVVADHLLRIPRVQLEGRDAAYATKEELQETISLHSAKNGVRRARQCLSLSMVGADSAPETKLRLAISRAGLPAPDVNQPIIDASGATVHESDLSFPAYRVAVEYEGVGHSDPVQVERDINRAERLEAAGWVEVRISKRHMNHGAEAALAKIRAVLISRGWEPG